MKESTGYKIRNPNGIHYVTFTIVGWIDVFSRERYKEILLKNLDFCVKNKGLELYAYVVMTNHLHLIISCKRNAKQEDIIRDFKKFTSKEIVKAIKQEPESRREWMLRLFEDFAIQNKTRSQYQVWQKGYHPIELDSNYLKEQKLNYIHENPVRAGIVSTPEAYVYSSAKYYAGESGDSSIQLL